MRVTARRRVIGEFEHLRQALLEGPEGWMPGMYEGVRTAIEPLLANTAVGTLSRYAQIELGSPAAGPGEVSVPVTWSSLEATPLFPVLHGRLRLERLSGSSWLVVEADYEPPAGALGELLDLAALHSVAQATVDDFLERTAGVVARNALSRAVAEEEAHSSAGTRAAVPILEVMRRRSSARMPFDPQSPVAEHDLEQILEAARWAPTAHNMQNFEVVVVADPRRLQAMGEIASELSGEFLQENFQQMSFSEEELLERKVGVLASMFPPVWRTPFPDLEEARRARSTLDASLQGAPLVLLVVYDNSRRAPASAGDVLGIMSLGCVLENMWLVAEALGLGFQVISALASESVRAELARILGTPAGLAIAYGCRLGYPRSAPGRYLRVRRDTERFVHRERW